MTQTVKETRPFVRLSIVRPSYGWTKRDASYKFKGKG